MPATPAPPAPPTPLILTGAPISIADVESVARRARPVQIGSEARSRLDAARTALTRAISGGAPIYGVNTGFGALSRQRIADADLEAVQRNLLLSHAAGVGPPLAEDIVRATMLILAASLCRGASGVRPEVVESIVALLNARITPLVPELGSVGASGDLAPLAHIGCVLLGEGEATCNGAHLSGAEALSRARLAPLRLSPKEGLALINGTHLMAARAALILADAQRLTSAAIAAAAMSIDACRATDTFLDERIYTVRAQPGPAAVAAQLRALLAGSQIVQSHREDDPRVQDPYSLRCAPYIIGAALDSIAHVRAAAERELAAVTDNPLVFTTGPRGSAEVISAGNFHGMPIALPLDALAPALAHIAGVAERRVYFMLSATDPEAHLTPQLSPRPGVQSGLMITQYTAAACCNELISLSTPATVANIPTCAGMEDYNSFGPAAASKAARAVSLARHVVAIELLCAAEALDRHRPLKSGAGVERAHALVRTVVAPLTEDRPPAPDIAAISALIEQGRFTPSMQ